MIRILFINPVSSLSGGAEHCLSDLVLGLLKKGFAPELVCPGEGELATFLRERGVLVRTRPWPAHFIRTSRTRPLLALGRLVLSFWGILKLVRWLRSVIREGNTPIVCTNGIKSHLLGIPACLGLSPLVWHFRDCPPTAFGRFLFWLTGSLFPRRIITPSDLAGRTFRLGPVKNKQVTVHDGVRIRDFSDVPHGLVLEAKKELGLEGKQPVIGSIGALVRIKGFEILLRALPPVLERFPDARLLIVGGSIYETDVKGEGGRLEGIARSLGIEDKVIFAGIRKDIPVMLSLMDVVVQASVIRESFGRVLVEAMATGRTVIGSMEGAASEVIRHGNTGILVPSGDFPALSGALIDLLSNPAKADAMARQAYREACSRFDIAVTIEKTASVYEEVASLTRLHG